MTKPLYAPPDNINPHKAESKDFHRTDHWYDQDDSGIPSPLWNSMGY